MNAGTAHPAPGAKGICATNCNRGSLQQQPAVGSESRKKIRQQLQSKLLRCGKEREIRYTVLVGRQPLYSSHDEYY